MGENTSRTVIIETEVIVQIEHFQDCYNRVGGYCSNMIIICRISQLFHNFDQNLLEIFQNLVDCYWKWYLRCSKHLIKYVN